MEKPPIVSAAEWQRARDELLVAEKEATRAQGALAPCGRQQDGEDSPPGWPQYPTYG